MKLVLVSLAVALQVTASQPPPQSTPVDSAIGSKQRADQGASETQRNNQPGISTSDNQAPGSKPAQRASQSGPRQPTPQTTPDPIVRYTFWLVVVAALQLTAMIGQGLVYFFTLRATKRSADAAHDSADIARDTLHLTQRADVLVDSIGLEPHPKPCILTAYTKIRVGFKNHGPTRATDVVIHTNLVVPGIAPKVPANDPTLPSTVIGGHDDVRLTFPPLGLLYDAATITEASRGNLRIQLEGRIAYSDVFGKSHSTNYRAVYYGEGSGGFVLEKSDAD